ncbi:MAG: hypothetical protein AB7O62_21425 [Pirellulales bacterium]
MQPDESNSASSPVNQEARLGSIQTDLPTSAISRDDESGTEFDDSSDGLQFFLSDLLILTGGIAAGLGAGNSLPPDAITFGFVCATVAGLLASLFFDGVRWIGLLWITMLAAFVAASLVAVMQGQAGP